MGIFKYRLKYRRSEGDAWKYVTCLNSYKLSLVRKDLRRGGYEVRTVGVDIVEPMPVGRGGAYGTSEK